MTVASFVTCNCKWWRVLNTKCVIKKTQLFTKINLARGNPQYTPFITYWKLRNHCGASKCQGRVLGQVPWCIMNANLIKTTGDQYINLNLFLSIKANFASIVIKSLYAVLKWLIISPTYHNCNKVPIDWDKSFLRFYNFFIAKNDINHY